MEYNLSGDAEATVAMIEEEGGKALAVYGGVTKPEDADRLVQAVIENFGRVDILVNNAGGTGSGGIESLDEAMWG